MLGVLAGPRIGDSVCSRDSRPSSGAETRRLIADLPVDSLTIEPVGVRGKNRKLPTLSEAVLVSSPVLSAAFLSSVSIRNRAATRAASSFSGSICEDRAGSWKGLERGGKE